MKAGLHSLWLVLLVAGCASGGKDERSSPAIGEAGVINFTDPGRGVRLVYPTQWNEQVSASKQTILVLTRGDETFSLVAQPVTETDLSAMERRAVEKYRGQFENFELLESSSTTLGGVPARRIVFSGKKLGRTFSTLNVLTIRNRTGFAAVYSADPTTFETGKPNAERIIASVQFMK